jgi:hypothetical protein
MKKIVIAILVSGTLLTSCMDKQVPMPQTVIKAKVDSIVNARKVEINEQAMEDLDHRSAIEVKVKADSIVQAQAAKHSKDTVNKAK